MLVANIFFFALCCQHIYCRMQNVPQWREVDDDDDDDNDDNDDDSPWRALSSDKRYYLIAGPLPSPPLLYSPLVSPSSCVLPESS